MKHLLGFRIFEAVGGDSVETYSSISYNHYYSEVLDGYKIKDEDDNHIKDLSPSERNLKKILDEFPSLVLLNGFYYTKLQDSLGGFDIVINEKDDEWFYLAVTVRTHVKFLHQGKYSVVKGKDNSFFKCDQLQGVLDCIRDIYSFGK